MIAERIVAKERDEIAELEEETELLNSEDVSEEKVQELLKKTEEEEAAEDRKEVEHAEWLANREAKMLEIKKALTTVMALPRRGDKSYQSDQSESEDSPLVTENIEPEQTEQEPPAATSQTSSSTSVSVSTSFSTPVVEKSPSSSPLLTALLHSPSKTNSFPTSPINHLASPSYKTPTTGTNLLTRFSLASTPTTPAQPSSQSTVISPVTSDISVKQEEETDMLADIDELLKDKVRQGEISKEDIGRENEREKQGEKETEITKTEEVEEADEVSKTELDGGEIKTEEVKVKAEEPAAVPEPAKKIFREQSANIEVKTEAASPAVKTEMVSPKAAVKGETSEPVGLENKALTSVQHGLDGVESVPASPHSLTTPGGSRSLTPTPATSASTPSSAKSVTVEEDRDFKAWKKSIILVWGQISQHKNANLFASAVTEADAPDYRDIVIRPMDLNSIKKNVESGLIKTTEEFERDLMLMFLNATMYNCSDHEVYKLSRDMYEDTKKILKDYKNAQLLLKENEPKSLRGKSESAESGVTRPRGRSVSGSVGPGDTTPVSSRSDTRKRERSGSLMMEETARAEKKRKI